MTVDATRHTFVDEADRGLIRGVSAALARDRRVASTTRHHPRIEHGVCLVCHPGLEIGQWFTAACGRRVIAFTEVTATPPPNACPACLELADAPCPGCGA